MKRFATYILGSSAYVAGMGLTITSAWLITMASSEPPLLTLSVSIVMVRFFGISRSVARYFERLTSHKVVFDQLTILRVQLFEKITSRPISLVRDFNSGELVKRVVDDVERAQEYQLRITLPQVAATISVATGVLLGWWIRPQSLLVTVPVSVLLLVVIPALLKRGAEIVAREVEISESEYATLIEQAAHGVVEAELYGYLAERLERTVHIEDQIWRKEKSLLSHVRRYQFTFIISIGLTLVSLSWLAFHFNSVQKIPAVQITMLIFLPLVMFEGITAWYPNLYGAGKMLLARSEISALQNPADIIVPAKSSSSPKAAVIHAHDVQVKWDQHFMTPVSFDLNPGDCLVIRGRSGSGKSTLAMALLGLLPYDGQLTLDGIELREVEQSWKWITGSIQSGHVFNTSLRENLKIAAPDATDELLLKTLSIVELDLLVDQMSDGLDTVIGELGRSLSGGEVKRLNLARAFLSPAPVVVLDEPTEHLDSELALRIEDRICALGRTLIVITHSGWNRGTKTLHLLR